jgi:hypothetical protein
VGDEPVSDVEPVGSTSGELPVVGADVGAFGVEAEGVGPGVAWVGGAGGLVRPGCAGALAEGEELGVVEAEGGVETDGDVDTLTLGAALVAGCPDAVGLLTVGPQPGAGADVLSWLMS